MIGPGLVAGVAALAVVGLVRAWARSGPASALRRGLWLLMPAAVLAVVPLALEGPDQLADAVGAVSVLLVMVGLLRATPARGVGSTREHATEAAIAGLVTAVLVVGLLPVPAAWSATAVLLLTAEASALWLVSLGRREVRPQGRALQWLVAAGLVTSAVLRLAGELGGGAGAGSGSLVATASLLVPALAWTAAAVHPQARAPLPHVTRSAPRLARRQTLLLVVAALIGATSAVAWPLAGLAVDGWAGTTLSASLTLLVVVHLLLLVDHRGRNVWEAQHDALTGLPTEPLFEDRLRQAIASARRSGSGLTVAFVDLDGFKQVNDTCGHEAGDEVLRRTADRLTRGLRDQDTVARRSGDEFLLLLADTGNPAVAQEIVERVLSSLAEPMEVAGQHHQVGASAGLASWPRDGLDADELMQHADEAMYDAKEAGRGQVCWHRTMAATRTHLRLALSHHLHEALTEGGQLELDHQPLVDLRDGTIDGLVCRARWRHPALGRLSPSAFLPVATRTGLWRLLDLEVVRMACEQAATWRAARLLDVPLTVPLSREHASSPELAGDVLAILDRYRLPARALVLAVSEEALCHGGEAFATTVDELADRGVEVVVSGFGSADVGIRRLSHVRIAGLELAGALVDRVAGVEGPVVDTVIRLAHGLGLRVQADGVADDTQAETLRSRGCVVARGSGLAPPVAGGDLTARLRSRRRSAEDAQQPLALAELVSATGHEDDTSCDDSLLTAALAETEMVLESDLTDLLRRVGESPLGTGTVLR